MLASFLHLLLGRSPARYPDHALFVETVQVQQVERRDPRVERLILVCWVLIAVKHVAIIWAAQQYRLPFHQLWVNFPTWLLGLLATGLYFGRAKRS